MKEKTISQELRLKKNKRNKKLFIWGNRPKWAAE